jgi:hypothetical protein
MQKLFAAFVLLLLVSCTDSTARVEPVESSVANTKKKTAVKEQSQVNMLDAKANFRKNLLRQWVLEGMVTNNSSSTSFKNVVILISYYDKSGKELGKTERSIIKSFTPHSSQHFQFKTEGFPGTSSLKYKVIAATPVN